MATSNVSRVPARIGMSWSDVSLGGATTVRATRPGGEDHGTVMSRVDAATSNAARLLLGR
jgi:hypothetical protein